MHFKARINRVGLVFCSFFMGCAYYSLPVYHSAEVKRGLNAGVSYQSFGLRNQVLHFSSCHYQLVVSDIFFTYKLTNNLALDVNLFIPLYNTPDPDGLEGLSGLSPYLHFTFLKNKKINAGILLTGPIIGWIDGGMYVFSSIFLVDINFIKVGSFTLGCRNYHIYGDIYPQRDLIGVDFFLSFLPYRLQKVRLYLGTMRGWNEYLMRYGMEELYGISCGVTVALK